MRNSPKRLARLTPLLAICALLLGADQPSNQSNPYHAIIERNLFGLKPVPQPAAAEPERPSPVRITLTGITTILGDKRVLMKTAHGQTPERSYILTVGQREGDIEVLEIDENTGNVTLNNAGVVMRLNLDKDGPLSSVNQMPSLGALPPPPAALPHRFGTFSRQVSPAKRPPIPSQSNLQIRGFSCVICCCLA